MAYGVNAPTGFVPVAPFDVPANPNAQLNTSFSIQNGYDNNIAVGDLIYIGVSSLSNTGYVSNYIDAFHNGTDTNVTANLGPILGVFQGVQYPGNNNIISSTNAAGWSDVWVAGTMTADGSNPKVRFLPLSNGYVYSIQTDSNGAQLAQIGQFGAVQYSNNASGLSFYNTVTNQSILSASFYSAGPFVAGTRTLMQLVGFDNQNSIQGASQVGIPYGQVLVRLCDTELPFLYSTNPPR